LINFVVELIQSICLIVAAIIILITALGILRLDDDMEKVIYVRIHMLGMVDIACVLAIIGLGQYLVAAIYFVLAPFVAHALANAYYHSEDDRKYETNDELTGRINDAIYTELALNKDTTIDAKFKSTFEFGINSSNEFDNESNDSSTDNSIIKSNVISYTQSEESKGDISDKLDVVIKEVSTDDIENSNLIKDKDTGDNKSNNENEDDDGGEKHD